LSISLKLTIQSTREMLWRILTTLGVPELNRNAQNLYTDVTINFRVGEKLEQFLSTSESQARRQSSTVLFIFVIHAVSNTLDKKWDFTTPDFRWFPDTQVGSKPRGQLHGTNHSNKGTCSRSSSPIMSAIRPSFFSRGEVAASSLSSLFDVLVWLFTLEVWEKAKTRNGGHSLSEAWTGIIGCWYGGHRNRRRPLYVLCIKFKYLALLRAGTQWHSRHHWTDQPSEKAIRLHEQAITGQQNIPIDIRRRLYQAIVVNIALWERKLGTERQTGPNWKLSTMDVSARCAGWRCGIAEKRITNEHVRGMVANSPTMDTLMETRRCRSQTQCNGRVKISEANAWRMVYDGKTSRETSADHTTCLHNFPQEARLWRRAAKNGWPSLEIDQHGDGKLNTS
jgi:hypothetical protein